MYRRSAGKLPVHGDFLKLLLQIQTKLKKFLIKEEKHYMIILYVLWGGLRCLQRDIHLLKTGDIYRIETD